MKLIACNTVAWIYVQLRRAITAIGYVCILLYMKLIGCNSVAWNYGQFGVVNPSAMGIYAVCCTQNVLDVLV